MDVKWCSTIPFVQPLRLMLGEGLVGLWLTGHHLMHGPPGCTKESPMVNQPICTCKILKVDFVT